jgi:predicted lipase
MDDVILKSDLSTISKDLYDDLVHYFKYASSAYSFVCPRPNGNTLVLQLSNPVTDIQGFVARDNQRKEIIVALRGSASLTNILTDSQLLLVPFIAPGVKLPSGICVHSGFLLSWDSIALQVYAVVRQQISSHPDYSIVTTGHSLGGSLALLAAISLMQNFPDSKIRTYSYGAPRTGNRNFSDYVNETFGKDALRVVHGNDG